MSLTNYLEAAFVNHLTGIATMTQPSNLYLGLISDTADDTGGGTELTNGTAPGYARQLISFAAYAADKALSTNSPVFAAVGANWPTVPTVAIYDALTNGNMLWYGSVQTPFQVNDGGTETFNAGDVDLSLD